jgi:hypothetical protein
MSGRGYAWCFCLLVLLVLLYSDKGKIEGDGIARWEAMVALAEQGRLTEGKYSLAQPLLAMPLYAAGAGWSAITGAGPERRPAVIQAFVQQFNKFVAFGLALWLFLFLRNLAGWPARQASLAVILLLFGSLVVPHAEDFFSECLWTLLCLVSLTLLCLFRGRPLREFGVGKTIGFVAAMALVVPLNPLLALVLALLAGLIVMVPPARIGRAVRRPEVSLLVISLALGIGLCLLENWLRRGNALDFGYPGEGFTTPFLHGLAGQLVAPARGVVWFMPAFFLGFVLARDRRRSLAGPVRDFVRLSLVFSLLLMAAYAKWHAWHGAWYWGPRFLLALSVLGCLYLALFIREQWRRSAAHRAVLATLALLSFMVYKVGVSIGLERILVCLREHPLAETCYWNWAFLPHAAWVRWGDVAEMLADRSTVVELAAAGLFFLLLRFAPREDGR